MLFRHKKTKGIYQIQMLVTNETDLSVSVVYSNYESGTIWVRPASEFFDGRYERVIEGTGITAEAMGPTQ